MNLRDYQIDICTRVREAFGYHRSVMVQMPTGTGKTVVLASLVSQLKNENVLIVAHRRELIEQIKATIKRLNMEDRNITVESIQTISRHLTSNGVATPPRRGAGGLLLSCHRRSPPCPCQNL